LDSLTWTCPPPPTSPTGAPTVLILTVGLVMVPQAVSTARLRGTYTFQRSLPVPRLLLLAADLTMWGAGGAAVDRGGRGASGALWYGFELRVDWPLLLGTAALTVLTASATGYAIAVLLPPLLAQVTTQVVLFFIMLFSPVTFPPEPSAGVVPGPPRPPARPGPPRTRSGRDCSRTPTASPEARSWCSRSGAWPACGHALGDLPAGVTSWRRGPVVSECFRRFGTSV
ncbi:hypothetical protein D9C01_12365, partial [Corynebacterium diphtheriae]